MRLPVAKCVIRTGVPDVWADVLTHTCRRISILALWKSLITWAILVLMYVFLGFYIGVTLVSLVSSYYIFISFVVCIIQKGGHSLFSSLNTLGFNLGIYDRLSDLGTQMASNSFYSLCESATMFWLTTFNIISSIWAFIILLISINLEYFIATQRIIPYSMI